MKAKIMIPNRLALSAEIYREIKLGNMEWAHSCFHSKGYLTNGYQWDSVVKLDSPADGVTDLTPEEIRKHEYDFLENAFEHTAISEEWEEKRPICVGDILMIKDGGTWYCAPNSWEKI